MACPKPARHQEVAVSAFGQAEAHSVRSHLRLEIDSYDETIRRFIPGYEEGLAKAAQIVAGATPQKVLDLGAGTGALSEAVLLHKEVAYLQAIDIDSDMLGKARTRLARFGARVGFSLGSFSDPLPNCDAVTASLALHHVPTLDDKRLLYGRIFDVLRPGGVLVNADVTMSTQAEEREASYSMWADHLVANGISRARAFEHFAEWAEEDTYFPLETELDAMREAGFRAECVWKKPPNCVFVGYKDRISCRHDA